MSEPLSPALSPALLEKLDALLDRIGLIDGIQQTYTSVVLSRKIDRRMTAALSQLAESAA